MVRKRGKLSGKTENIGTAEADAPGGAAEVRGAGDVCGDGDACGDDDDVCGDGDDACGDGEVCGDGDDACGDGEVCGDGDDARGDGDVCAAPGGPRRYRVIVDRMPYWKGRPQPLNALIEGSRLDPAIRAMLERRWIEAV